MSTGRDHINVLFVGMSNSVHAARWVHQLSGEEWRVSLFPVDTVLRHPDLSSVTTHPVLWYGRLGSWMLQRGALGSACARGMRTSERMAAKVLDKYRPGWRARRLARVIERIRPDVVHSMEMQEAGYLMLEARRHLLGKAPPWIVGIWGSDVYLFGRMPSHTQRVRAVLAQCDYYLCECQRDVDLALALGLCGQVLPPLPAHGGLDMAVVRRLRGSEQPSSRRVILVKGYQSFSGRALVALRAIALAADALRGYRVRVFSASPDVEVAAELLGVDSGVDIQIIPQCGHEELMSHIAQARVVVGLGISDGLPSSLVEAMALGAFPIQSSTSCVGEWIVNGETGFIVSPEDPHEVARALRMALEDDSLVDCAGEANARIVVDNLSSDVIASRVITMYREIVVNSRNGYRAAGM